MIKINFLIERIMFFICGLIILSLLVTIGIIDFDINDIIPILIGSISSILFFIFSITFHLTYDNDSLTIYVFFHKRTYQFKELKNVYVFLYNFYYISFFDSRAIAIPGIGEKKKLSLLFEAIKKNQPALEVFE